jgi:hypothetical protein
MKSYVGLDVQCEGVRPRSLRATRSPAIPIAPLHVPAVLANELMDRHLSNPPGPRGREPGFHERRRETWSR